MDIYQIIKRWHQGYSITQIHRALRYDGKTIRRYITLAQSLGLDRSTPLPEKTTLLKLLKPLIPERKGFSPAQQALEPFKPQIEKWLTQKTDPLKPKTIFELLSTHHGLQVSYSSFKRFIRQHFAEVIGVGAQLTCFFDTEPGEEVQIDYAKMGRLLDPVTQRHRDVYAFIAMLSYSRLKFVQFAYKQDQKGFVAAIVAMFEFFGGVPQRIVIDNLKAGVLKPDLYMPTLNPLIGELSEHYGVFIDPARPGKPKDEGKIERCVPIIREAFRKFKALDPHLDLAQANQHIRKWCLHDNGQTPHATTGQKPLELFNQIEKQALRPLPTVAFEIATWKKAKVHLDQCIQFENGFYSLPQRLEECLPRYRDRGRHPRPTHASGASHPTQRRIHAKKINANKDNVAIAFLTFLKYF